MLPFLPWTKAITTRSSHTLLHHITIPSSPSFPSPPISRMSNYSFSDSNKVPLGQSRQPQASTATPSPAPTASSSAPPAPMGPSAEELDAEDAERERQLADLISLMDTYRPVIPDTVTDYYLSEAGFQTSDPRIKRLLALAAQKFIADVAADAYRFARVRPQTAASRRNGKDKRTILTNDDLASALGEYGVNVRKPDYYQ